MKALDRFVQSPTSDLRLSDVLESIQSADPENAGAVSDTSESTTRFYSTSAATTSRAMNNQIPKNGPYVRIVEQPAPKEHRFRYKCEGRSAGSIPGINSTEENKTYPTIEVVGYKGRAIAVVSCVTKDGPPYRPHPHSLVGREGCKKGICTMPVDPNTMRLVFQSLGVQCAKKRDIDQELKLREEIRVDPFQTGFGHKSQPGSIDLSCVRLCFQVFLESEKNKYPIQLEPVVSDPIYGNKSVKDLFIYRLSHYNSSVAGGREMIILCEKVNKDDIAVKFFEKNKANEVVWEAYGDFQASDVHKQYAIILRTPRYKSLEVKDLVLCQIQLERPSDGEHSEPRDFQYLPLNAEWCDQCREGGRKKKIPRFSPNHELNQYLREAAPQSKQEMEAVVQIGDLHLDASSLLDHLTVAPPSSRPMKHVTRKPRGRTQSSSVAEKIASKRGSAPQPGMMSPVHLAGSVSPSHCLGAVSPSLPLEAISPSTPERGMSPSHMGAAYIPPGTTPTFTPSLQDSLAPHLLRNTRSLSGGSVVKMEEPMSVAPSIPYSINLRPIMPVELGTTSNQGETEQNILDMDSRELIGQSTTMDLAYYLNISGELSGVLSMEQMPGGGAPMNHGTTGERMTESMELISSLSISSPEENPPIS